MKDRDASQTPSKQTNPGLNRSIGKDSSLIVQVFRKEESKGAVPNLNTGIGIAPRADIDVFEKFILVVFLRQPRKCVARASNTTCVSTRK